MKLSSGSKTILLVMFAAAMQLMLPLCGSAYQSVPDILYPRDQTVVGRTVSFVVDPDTVGMRDVFFQVVVGERKGPLVNASALHVVPGGVALDPGVNLVTVSFFRQALLSGRMQEFARQRIVLFSDQQRRSLEAMPQDISRAAFHRGAGDAGCLRCHGEGKENRAEGGACISCHPSVAARQIVHGPVAAGACAACHGMEGGEAAVVPAVHAGGGSLQGQMSLCGRCHRETVSQRVTHGPVAAGMCTVCHDPHSGEHPGRLRMSVNDLCRGCHADPLATCAAKMSAGSSAPVVCTVCHDPHGAENHNLLLVKAVIP